MKAIILAGGAGTRLHPMTKAYSKQLLPIYDKPMVYYPISIAMLARIRDIAIITTPKDQELFKDLLGDGSQFGVRFTYLVQPEPKGIAQAFLIAEEFINNDSVMLILGDNIFYGAGLTGLIRNAIANSEYTAQIFGIPVKDPGRFGVAFMHNNQLVKIVEKPKIFLSNLAVVGLYIYPADVVLRAKTLKPSSRGELEITSLNNLYINDNLCHLNHFGRGITWLDTGTPDSLLQAANFVHSIQDTMGIRIADLNEIAIANEWITPPYTYLK